MSRVEVTYTVEQECKAVDLKTSKSILADCPMSKGEQFGPGGLVAAGLGSCMLISMSSFAKRHGIDVTGARADVGTVFGGAPEMRISAIDVTMHVPGTFTEEERAGLERAAGACPIKHSFRADTKVSTRFAYGDVAAVAA